MTKWTQDDKDKIAGMLHKRMSAEQICPHFNCSRNSIIGVVHRDPVLRAIGLHGGTGSIPKKKSRYHSILAKPKLHPGNIARKRESRAFDPGLTEPVVVTAFECRSVPMLDLKHGECRWPVNDAARGELHLFCGNPANGSYCHAHFIRSIGGGTESERSTHRELRRAA